MSKKLMPLISVLLITLFLITACSPGAAKNGQVPLTSGNTTQSASTPASSSGNASSGQKVTINWWHISTVANQKALMQKFADEYMAAHPNVKINITVLENQAFKTKMTTVMQSGNPPDIFQSWGGGVMAQYAQAGLLKDITPDLEANNSAWKNTFSQNALNVYSYNGKYYGVPWDMGMVGFWYNKDLFTKAGISTPPTTWTDFLNDVKKLKAAGITPIALGEGDKWPGAFWWEYLALRVGGKPAFEAAYTRKGSFTDPPFVQAGTDLKQLIDLQPFQNGSLGGPYADENTAMGNGKAAMELMGQWALSVDKDASANKQGVSMGWFPFPAVEGGAGGTTDVLGGGNGYAIGKNAPSEAVDFVKFLSNVDNQTAMAKIGMSVPVVHGAEAGLTDPNLLEIQKTAEAAKYFQLYYDQFLPPAMGSVVNDATQALFAGKATPQQTAQQFETSAKQELK